MIPLIADGSGALGIVSGTGATLLCLPCPVHIGIWLKEQPIFTGGEWRVQMNKIKLTLVISFIVFCLLVLISVVFTSSINRDVIGMGGLAAGFILLLPSVKLHRLLFFGSRADQTEIFPDEHLQHQLYKQIEQEERNKGERKANTIFDALGYSGMALIIISLFVIT